MIASEQRFGIDGDVTLVTPGGRQLAVYGSVDRIDRTPDWPGRHRPQVRLPDDVQQHRPHAEPTSGGTLFQLPAYAPRRPACRCRSRRHPVRPVRAEYSFFARGQATSGSATSSTPRCGPQVGDGPAPHRVGRRGRMVPGHCDQAQYQIPHRLPVLRARLARHRRALRRMGAQAARPAPRPVVRGRRADVDDSDADATQAVDERRHCTTARPSGIAPVRTELERNLFVEAGAGAGKTSSLVDRIVELVRSGVEIGSVAAITFTEKAAADLRHRLRDALPRRRSRGDHDLFARESLRRRPRRRSTTPRSARCTPSPDACSTNSPWPPGCRPVSACSTSSRATSPSRSAGRICSIACSTIRIPSGGAIDGGVELVQLLRLRQFRAARDVPACRRRVPRELGPGRRPCRHIAATAVEPRHRPLLAADRRGARGRHRPTTTRQAGCVAELARVVRDTAVGERPRSP